MTVETFYYSRDGNYFEDIDGNVIYDLFKYVSPSRLSLIKRRSGYYYVYPPLEDTVYEFYIPFDEDEDETGDEYGWHEECS